MYFEFTNTFIRQFGIGYILVKKVIPGETKKERKRRKRLEKSLSSFKSAETSNRQKYVICLKHGIKYNHEYVNNLYSMVSRNLTVDYRFICFTEDSKNINSSIEIRPLPDLPVKGWWYKPSFFNTNLGLDGTVLFLDLDIVIFRNIDKLFDYEPDKLCIIRDFNRYRIKNYQKCNSSVFRFNTGDFSEIYDKFIRDTKYIMKRYLGDQDWIFSCIQKETGYAYWPDEWIQSYKWEMRGRPTMIQRGDGNKDFVTPGEPKIQDETAVAVFHGHPNPHVCCDPWVKNNWR